MNGTRIEAGDPSPWSALWETRIHMAVERKHTDRRIGPSKKLREKIAGAGEASLVLQRSCYRIGSVIFQSGYRWKNADTMPRR